MPLSKILKKWILTSYDSLGLVVMSSLIWSAAGTGLIAVVFKLSHGNLIAVVGGIAAVYVLVLSPLAAGVFFVARNIVTRDFPSARDLFVGFKRYMVNAWALGLAQLVITGILILNAWFYLKSGIMAFELLGIVFLYAILFWGMSAIYHYPLLVDQKAGLLKTLKRGFLIMGGSPGFTAGVFFAIIMLTCLCAFARFLLPLVWIGMVAVLETLALRALFVKFGLIEPEPEPSDEDQGFNIPERTETNGESDLRRHTRG